MRQRIYLLAKRCFDTVASFAGILLFSPLLLVIAIGIKLDSPGPVFYRGIRTGRFGVPFRIFKFRSMVIDGEARGGTTTGDNDPRLTHVGRFLRRYKLDELPQLLNVVVGHMSLVGPRPEVAEYTNAYSEQERRILSVRPGITDLASIEFNNLQEIVGSENPDQTFREKVLPVKNALRLLYVEQQSIWTDLSILGRTIFILIARPLRG